jgi:hypothetical protein
MRRIAGIISPELWVKVATIACGVMTSRFLPALFLAGLLSIVLFPSVNEQPGALWSVVGAAAALAFWYILLLVRGGAFSIEAAVRKQHYIQACAQGSVLVYWGWYWRDVYAYTPLILAQLLFAYLFQMLLSWTRGATYQLGFGPFPIVFSINLFLWFKPDWFYLQFALVALGLIAKEFLRWERDGRRVHIFNPSSFPLAIASAVLLALGASDVTRGQEIAVTQFYPPYMYPFLFLVGLPGQFLFGVTSMTMSAVLSTVLFGWAYFAVTGVYFFYDSYVPIAVFLGMHLLFTDPSTSPRSELGRIIFGTLYGLSAVALYYLLGMRGLPTFYDKLVQVPLLNLSVRAIDRLTASPAPVIARYKRNLAYISVWAVIFFSLSASNILNDNHPGQWVPFWQRACDNGRAYACPYLADLDQGLCNQGSPWACNEAGLMQIALSRSGEDLRRTDPRGAGPSFDRGCELGLETACGNATMLANGSDHFAASQPTVRELPILLRGSKGEILEKDPNVLMALACKRGWDYTCQR